MMEITPELAEICGIYAGDGYLRHRITKIELEIGGDKEEKDYYDNNVLPLINNFFKLNIKGKFYVKGTYGFVTTNPNFKILNGLGFPYEKKSLIVQVPRLILESNDKLLFARFLRGLFDTDGGVHFTNRKTLKNYGEFKKKHNYYPILRFTTVSEILGDQIIFLLKELGFDKVRMHSFQPKDLRDKRKYIVYMSGKDALVKFFSEVGSMNPVKLSRFQLWEKFGFCPPHTTLSQRKDILNGKLDINSVGRGS